MFCYEGKGMKIPKKMLWASCMGALLLRDAPKHHAWEKRRRRKRRSWKLEEVNRKLLENSKRRRDGRHHHSRRHPSLSRLLRRTSEELNGKTACCCVLRGSFRSPLQFTSWFLSDSEFEDQFEFLAKSLQSLCWGPFIYRNSIHS